MSLKPNIERTELEQFFEPFRKNILGIDQAFRSPFGEKNIVYLDWTASGRLYAPIEEKMLNEFGPFVANTHTEIEPLLKNSGDARMICTQFGSSTMHGGTGDAIAKDLHSCFVGFDRRVGVFCHRLRFR